MLVSQYDLFQYRQAMDSVLHIQQFHPDNMSDGRPLEQPSLLYDGDHVRDVIHIRNGIGILG